MADSDEKKAAYERMWRMMVEIGIAERKDREGDMRNERALKLVCSLMVDIGGDVELAKVVKGKLEAMVDSLQAPPCQDEKLLCDALRAASIGSWVFEDSGKPKSIPDGIQVFYRKMLQD